MTKQWEKFRDIIIAEYKGQNKPLHEVQRIMIEQYGFKASTRAYRSRFDRWHVHKYSPRKRRESTSGDAARPSPRQSPDVEESSALAVSPATPDDLLGSGVCAVGPTTGFRSPLKLAKSDLQYDHFATALRPAMLPGLVFPPSNLGIRLDLFGAEGIGCYSPSALSLARQATEDEVVPPMDPSTPGRSSTSRPGSQDSYGYSAGFLTPRR